jgi:hypothetical protein
MRGRATLAMVWSSACRNQASITETVIRPRFNAGGDGSFATTAMTDALLVDHSAALAFIALPCSPSSPKRPCR